MPCSNVIARLLLKEGRAKIKYNLPFTIRLLQSTSNYTQSLTHGLDTGSSKIGSAVVNKENEVIYTSEITIRNNVSERMSRRSDYRRKRRSNKTRYRKNRFLNRRNSIKKDRFSPTITSKVNSHVREINFVNNILPITKLVLETASFDTHALKNPEVLKNKSLYQKGPNYGFANTKAFVLNRDSHLCQSCRGKSRNKKVEVHHIIYRSAGGSDDAENLITLCKICHDNLHDGNLVLKSKGKKKDDLKHASHMNSIRIQLLKRFPNAQETFGFITKENRQLLGIKKTHINDSIIIASAGNRFSIKQESVLYKKCIPVGDYQRSKGIRSEIKIPKGKIQGFLKFDKVRYLGKRYFIKGRYSTGYAILQDIYGNKISLKPIPKLKKMVRLAARKSWLLDIGNFNLD